MFCPQCGSTQSDELKFCKLCGANLSAVRQAVATRETGGIDWGKTWVAEMFMSSEEAVKRQAELERLRGITPEVKRYREIKAGVITGCVGLAATLVIFVIMDGIVSGGDVTPVAAPNLRPPRAAPAARRGGPQPHALRAADTSEFTPSGFGSVTEETTIHLRSPGPKQ